MGTPTPVTILPPARLVFMRSEPHLVIVDNLVRHVDCLAGLIGPRHLGKPSSMAAAAGYVDKELAKAAYATQREEYVAASVTVANVVAELPGSARPDDAGLAACGTNKLSGCCAWRWLAIIELKQEARSYCPAFHDCSAGQCPSAVIIWPRWPTRARGVSCSSSGAVSNVPFGFRYSQSCFLNP